tara:strand:+ start:552 stop:1187 length:636 start_codon:yes stop_codon:yes gene_type:complete
MRVYLANHNSMDIGYLAGRYEGRVGWLLTPEGLKGRKPRSWMPIALDNGAWSCYLSGESWQEKPWLEMLDTVEKLGITPDFVVAPDKVGDRDKTMKMYFAYRHHIVARNWKVAFAIQDGMKIGDIPHADMYFLGGSTKYKWRNLEAFAEHLEAPLHVARVNTIFRLKRCEELGVTSTDGTGWFRRPPEEWIGDLSDFFENKQVPQMELDYG